MFFSKINIKWCISRPTIFEVNKGLQIKRGRIHGQIFVLVSRVYTNRWLPMSSVCTLAKFSKPFSGHNWINITVLLKIKTPKPHPPVGSMLASTTVGTMDPQPDSTITTPSGSFLVLGTITYRGAGLQCDVQRYTFVSRDHLHSMSIDRRRNRGKNSFFFLILSKGGILTTEM